MSINDPLSFLLPEDLAAQIGDRARARRLAANLTRKTLAKQSGVPESTLRKFEVTGVISFVSLLQLADTLGCMDDFSKLSVLLPEQDGRSLQTSTVRQRPE